MKQPRFSKAVMIAWLDKRIAWLIKEHRIDTNNGTAQCEQWTDKRRIIGYGEYMSLVNTRDAIEGGYVAECAQTLCNSERTI